MEEEKINERIESIRSLVLPVLKRYPVKRAGLFGSVLREDFDEKSDIDVLVQIEDDSQFSLFDMVSLKSELEKLLSKGIDLVEYDGIKRHYREYILPNERPIYEKDD